MEHREREFERSHVVCEMLHGRMLPLVDISHFLLGLGDGEKVTLPFEYDCGFKGRIVVEVDEEGTCPRSGIAHRDPQAGPSMGGRS